MDFVRFTRSVLFLLGLLASFAITPVQAVTTVSRDFGGNDCAGFFGSGFDACTIFVNDSGQKIEISPVIAKWDLASWETNGTLYPSVDGTEFTVEANAWSYAPGTSDPLVRFWATKAGPDFRLFWTVADSAAATGGVCDVADLFIPWGASTRR